MVDDWILPSGIEIVRRVQQAVQIGRAVARLDGDRLRRAPARDGQTRDVRLFDRGDISAVCVAKHRDRRNVRLRIHVDEVLSRRRERHVVIGVLRREELEIPAVHSDPIEMPEVRIAAALSADADEVQRAVRLVYVKQLRHVAFSGRDLALLASGLQIVQIEMAPVVALGEPDHFVRSRQVPPVDPAVARFVKRLGFFLHHLADESRRRIGHAQLLALVVPRRRHECHRRTVRTPLHVAPDLVARDVVAQRRSMLIGRHLQPRHLARLYVDDDPLNHRDRRIARQRVLPRLQHRMPDLRLDQVHLADAALILLIRGDLLRVGRPRHDWAIAVRPSRVVGRVAEVFHAVERQLRFLVGRHVANPQIPVTDEDRLLPVR